jgi:hypothetical protein
MIFEDNQACIALSKNSLVNARSKHIDIKYHFNREKVESGEVVLKYCPSAEMIADVMTNTARYGAASYGQYDSTTLVRNPSQIQPHTIHNVPNCVF